MLDILLKLQKNAPIKFELIAVNLDQKQPGFPEHVLPDYLTQLGVPYHILEEEKELFAYINLLDTAYYGKISLTKVFYPMQEHSISRFLRQHQQDDDDMQGIRELTNDYKTTPQTPLTVKVLYAELERFEQDLIIHARIENRILLPKALKLENKLKRLIEEKSRLN